MLRILLSAVTLVACCPMTAAAGGVEHVEVTHEGVTVRASVVPAGATLAHTTQVFPADDGGAAASALVADPTDQAERALARLVAPLAKVGASRDSLARVNLYAATPEAAAAAKRVLGGRVKCAVSTVVTSLPQAGALVALDAVAVATADASPDPANVRLLRSDRAVYISGMAAEGEVGEATRLTLEKLDAVLQHLKLARADVIHVKSFLRGGRSAAEVSAARAAIARFFDGQPPPATFVEWTMDDPVEIELVVRSPAPAGTATRPADTVTYLNPPPATPSPLYSRMAVVHGGRLVYTSGVLAVAAPFPDAAAETRAVLGAMREVVTKAGGDFEHLAKATYYPCTPETAAALNKVRPEFFNPARPPAASKAPARGTGTPHAALTLDLIAAAAPTPGAAAAAPVAKAPAEVKDISIDEFERLRTENGVVVLDVRTPDEFKDGHVPGATNLDFLEKKAFAERLAALDKEKTYVVYCQSGKRSTRAVERMKELGFLRLYNFAGSMNEWETARKPVEKGEAKRE